MTHISRIVFTVILSLPAIKSNAQSLPETPLPLPQGFLPPDFVITAENEPDVVIMDAGAHYKKRVLTSTKPQITRSETFIPLKGARTELRLQPGTRTLVNVSFSAESRCNDPDGSHADWCEVRILVGGVEAEPRASSFPPDTYAFDSTDNGSESTHSWESHAMDRHRCIRVASSDAAVIPVEVQWKVTNFDGSQPPLFWLDDWSLTVELARGCRVRRK